MANEDEWAVAFAHAFAAGTPVEQRVYAEVFGAQHPAELDTYSCLTWDELHTMERWLGLGRGHELIDLGCGRAGPGVWLAARARARLHGVDITAVPLVAAAVRAEDAGVAATFTVGTLEATGLADGAADAVVSVDALLFAQDPTRALAEVRRILRPGGRLALTAPEPTDDLDGAASHPSATSAQAVEAGLTVHSCETPADWSRTARRITGAMLAASDAIATTTGADSTEVRDALEQLATARRQERRVLLLAQRPSER